MRTSTSQLIYTTIGAISLAFILCGSTSAQNNSDKQTVEPVFRIPKKGSFRQTTPSEPQQTPTPVVRAPAVSQPPVNTVVPPAQSVLTNPPPTTTDPPVTAKPQVIRVADAGSVIIPDKKNVDLIPDHLKTLPVTAHPLDRAIEVARNGLEGIRENVADYTAILVRRERVDNRLGEPNYIKIKIRNPRVIDGRNVPFSIYMKFIRPKGSAGREVIWVQGENNNNLIAHETAPLLRFKNFHLDPTGYLAMKGNKYPIYDAGLENLVLKLIEKAERDRQAGVCEVNYSDDAKVNKRPCSLIEVKHQHRRQPYEFHLAKVYIDEELQLPVRYESFDWPVAGQRPKVMEQYTYINIRTNVGLTDADFSISNPAYNFAK